MNIIITTNISQPSFILYPANYYQTNNAIVLNSNSYVRLGINVFNPVTVINGADFTFNAGSYIDLGTYFEVEPGATFTGNTGVPCNYSGSYRVEEETDYYEEMDRAELYASINAIEIPDHLDLDESMMKATLNVQIYPNPVSDIISVHLLSVPENDLKVSIFDALGQPIYSERISYSGQKEIKISATNMLNGVYEIIFSSGSSITTTKLVIQK